MVLKADRQFRTALALAEQPENQFLELARSLAEMYEDDRASLGRFIEQSGNKRRKAYYLLDLGKRLPKLDVSSALRTIKIR